jgi:hypothetical protein
LPKKKDRVITLRINEDDFRTVDNFAKARGLSVSAYISSIIKSQTEFYIPLASSEKVSIPKKALYSLFSYASKDSLNDLVDNWGIELDHVTRLLWGELNLQTSLDLISKIAKYLMGTDARVITTSKLTRDANYDEMEELSSIVSSSSSSNRTNYNKTPDNFWVIIRHNLGVNCSYFWNRMFTQFLENLKDSVDFRTEYDETTISIRLKKK